MAYEFKVGDTGKTRGGRSYRVIATDLKSDQTIAAAIEDPTGEEYVIAYFANGKVYAGGTPASGDLIPPAPAVYINVYEREDGTRWVPLRKHETRELADETALERLQKRIGCIRVELEARFDD